MNKRKNAKKVDEAIRDLLILHLWSLNIPIRNIVKASGISSRDIYDIIPKKSKNKLKS